MVTKEFHLAIRNLLNHFSDFAYLENSDALNLLLSKDEMLQPNQIVLFRNKIKKNISNLCPPENTPSLASEWRCFRILTLHYVNNMEMYDVAYEVGLSERQTYRELTKGINALTSILWNQYLKLQIGEEQGKGVDIAILDPNDLNLLQNELSNWNIHYELINLYQIIEQSYQLYEYSGNASIQGKIRYKNFVQNLEVRVDKILTKEGLYKILTMIENGDQKSEVWVKSRKLNDHFISLSISIKHYLPLDVNNWKIAEVYFTVQGLNHSLTELENETLIAINFPLMSQNKCLVIDDVLSVRTLIERMLDPYGIQVFGANNPQEALKLAQLMKPNFILLDILMPKVDGWQIIKMFKSKPETSAIPIFICSVLNEPVLSQAMGAAGLIRKPINRLELINTLQKASLIK